MQDGKPILVRPDDKVVQLKIEGHLPVLDDTCKVFTKEQFQKDKHVKKLFAMPTSQSSSKAMRAGVQGADAGRRSSERGRLLPNAVGVGLKVVQSGWF